MMAVLIYNDGFRIRTITHTYLENELNSSHNTHQNHMDDRSIDKPFWNSVSFCLSFFPSNSPTKRYNSNLKKNNITSK